MNVSVFVVWWILPLSYTGPPWRWIHGPHHKGILASKLNTTLHLHTQVADRLVLTFILKKILRCSYLWWIRSMKSWHLRKLPGIIRCKLGVTPPKLWQHGSKIKHYMCNYLFTCFLTFKITLLIIYCFVRRSLCVGM